MTMKFKAAFTACSNPRSRERIAEIERLDGLLKEAGVELAENPLLFPGNDPGGREKAEMLNRFFRDPDMDMIFDISGGDLANSVLPYLDYEAIRNSKALFFGYSDLTTILNAILARTGKETVNYQIRNMLYDHGEEQISYFRDHVLKGRITPDDLKVRFLRGEKMQGRILGGNIRCFLKLAGTPYWPEFEGSILLLESLGGKEYEMTTALEQYSQIGVFEKTQGILLGTFTRMEEEKIQPSMKEIVLKMVPEKIPVAETRLIGHGTDARAIVLGRETVFRSRRSLD